MRFGMSVGWGPVHIMGKFFSSARKTGPIDEIDYGFIFVDKRFETALEKKWKVEVLVWDELTSGGIVILYGDERSYS